MKTEHNALINYVNSRLKELGYKTSGNIHLNMEHAMPNPDIIAEYNGKKIAVEVGELSGGFTKLNTLLNYYDQVLWVKETRDGLKFMFFDKQCLDPEIEHKHKKEKKAIRKHFNGIIDELLHYKTIYNFLSDAFNDKRGHAVRWPEVLNDLMIAKATLDEVHKKEDTELFK